jgi:toxin YoeB
MVRKIIWTPQAKIDRFDILEHYYKKGTPKSTLRKLDLKIKSIIHHLSRFPSLGKSSAKNSERILYKEHYSIIYKYIDDDILILQLWDTRRNPEQMQR